MVYGTAGNDGKLLHESDATSPDPSNPHGLSRVNFENAVTAAGACVIRPGWVYGGNGGHYNGVFFKNLDLKTNTITIKGKGEKRYR